MQRSKMMLLVSHCIFNQNTVIPNEARGHGALQSAADWAIGEGFGIIQLPCPEFTFLGLNRPPMSYEDYNTCEYRAHCREILKSVIQQVEEYHKNGFEITGVFGIKGSPSCDPTHGSGVFMEELRAMLFEKSISIKKCWYFPNGNNPIFDQEVHFL